MDSKQVDERRVKLTVSLVLGLVAGIGHYLVLDRAVKAAQGGELRSVMFALRDLDVGESLSPADLLERDVPADFASPRMLDATAADTLYGKPLAKAVRAGEPLLQDDLWTRVTRMAYRQGITPGRRVLQLQVSENVGATALLQPGDHVDLIRPPNRRVRDESGAAPQVVAQDLRVLGIEGCSVQAGITECRLPRLVVAVSVAQANRLAELAYEGQLIPTLRGANDHVRQLSQREDKANP